MSLLIAAFKEDTNMFSTEIREFSFGHCLWLWLYNKAAVEYFPVWTSQLTFPEFPFETEAKVDFPSACIQQRRQNFE